MSERKRSEKRQRQKQVAVRFTEEEYALLMSAAEHEGTTPPGLLRDLLLAEYHPAAAGVTR